MSELIIGGLLVGGELGKCQLFAVKIYLSGGDELFILGGQLVVLLHFGNNFGRKAFKENVGIYKHHPAEFFLQLGTEFTFRKCLCHCLIVLGKGWVCVVEELVLVAVEFILGVDSVADIAEVVHCAVAPCGLVPGKICVSGGICGHG